MELSIIIPAYNEERMISNTLKALIDVIPKNLHFEIIVADHGSTDETVNIAKAMGAVIVDGRKASTIGALRNLAVSFSTGKILIFLDADIEVTPCWAFHFENLVKSLEEAPMQIAGSHPVSPQHIPLLLRHWFDAFSKQENPSHIGSGHLITSRKMFDGINGFPEDIETAEDVYFCKMGVKKGGKIVVNPKMVVIHNGVPKTILAFIKREEWHGRGDWSSYKRLISSKVAMASILFIVGHLFIFIGALGARTYGESSIFLFPLGLLLVCFLCLGSSIFKFNNSGLGTVLINSFVYYFYFAGRSLSLFSLLRQGKTAKRKRPGA